MTSPKLRVGLVVPHIFIHRDILPQVIFSPGELALSLAQGLMDRGVDVTLFTPGPTDTMARSITADLSLFESELAGRGDTYVALLKKHPFTFINLARQVQAEIIAKAYAAANNDEIDIVHIYTNEEDLALPFAKLCRVPVVFTHHDPFNFSVKYKNVFPKYAHLNWLSLSEAQRQGMPLGTNWVANIYHGIDPRRFRPLDHPDNNYVAYLGRIIQPKGVHIAINAVKAYNQTAITPLTLKIAGKHYADEANDTYWQKVIEPELGEAIEYVGHLKDEYQKQQFLGNARGLLVPSTFDEPFGMVSIESLASGTPVIGMTIGATPEIIESGRTGYIIDYQDDEQAAGAMAAAIAKLPSINRATCRQSFEQRFTLETMVNDHLSVYEQLVTESQDRP